MHNLLTDLPAGRTALLAVVPLLYLLAAIGPLLTGGSVETRWRLARVSAGAAAVATLLSFTLLLVGDAGLFRGPVLVSLGEFGALHLSLRSDALGALMLVLVSFIGWVIVGYSQPYLHGEHGQARYIRGLMLTLAAVTLQVMTNNLMVLALAWISTSLALHGLLTFFNTRPQALVAAHKKFIASRVADVCLIAAIVLIGQQLGTLEIDQAIAAAKSLPELTVQLQTAALLFAASALLKCAQLPVHGWLIQVMEAPTPVSALLHAGVVNLGGFLLIRLGGLVGDVPAAQAFLVVVGSTTAVVAALVMMTRISIKVSLAWSTCAQMGFMMMQCGLGLYDLALLHLLAHSLYKAHAFLGAGGAVEQNKLQQMTPPPAATVGHPVACGCADWHGAGGRCGLGLGLQPCPCAGAVGSRCNSLAGAGAIGGAATARRQQLATTNGAYRRLWCGPGVLRLACSVWPLAGVGQQWRRAQLGVDRLGTGLFRAVVRSARHGACAPTRCLGAWPLPLAVCWALF